MRDILKDYSMNPATEGKKTAEIPTRFKRIEKKYLLNSITAEILMSRIGCFIPRDPKSIISPNITSVYFDSPSWKCYNEHLLKRGARFKVRIRQYGNGTKTSPFGFLEMKSKSKGVTSKERVDITFPPLELGNEFLFSYGIAQGAKAIKPETRNGVFCRINDNIENYSLEPVSKVNYHRDAFETEDRRLRITFDSNIQFHAIRNSHSVSTAAESFMPENFMIMEVKNAGYMPSWLVSLLKSYKLGNARFSKYCASVKNLYLPAGLRPDTNEFYLPNNKLENEYGTSKGLIITTGAF